MNFKFFSYSFSSFSLKNSKNRSSQAFSEISSISIDCLINIPSIMFSIPKLLILLFLRFSSLSSVVFSKIPFRIVPNSSAKLLLARLSI